jgi:hypothetical protein
MSSKLRDLWMRFIISRWCVPVVILILTALGAWLRLYRLGDISMRMDEGNGWAVWKAGATIDDLLSGRSKPGGMPLTPVASMALCHLFHLPLTFFTFRLASALIGILAIPLAYFCGRIYEGRSFGVVTALLIAIHPVHIQCSREAYPYVYAVTGALAVLIAILLIFDSRAIWKRSRACFLVLLLFLAFLLLVHATISAWPFAAVAALTVMMGIVLRVRRDRRFAWLGLGVLAVLAVIWGGDAFQFITKMISERGIQAFPQAGYNKEPLPLFPMSGMRSATNFAWGLGGFRLGFTALILGLAVCISVRFHRSAKQWVIPAIIVVGFTTTAVFAHIKENPFQPRFVIMLLPAYVLLLVTGLRAPLSLFDRLRVPSWVPSCVSAGLTVVACMLYAQPVMWVLDSNGRTPLGNIVKWADANLSDGAPILCDRYFTAWNEFRWNASTNVAFMSTVPNEPPDYYPKSQFRERSDQFFEQNLDAAFFESRMFWDRFGAWTSPHSHFAHHKEFVDEATWHLHDVGLSYRGGGSLGVSLETLTTRLYYNTTEDFERIAKRRNTNVLAVFGRGWTYFKAQKFLDLRLMNDGANIDLYYFGKAPASVRLLIKGVASGGAVKLTVNNRVATLPNGQFLELPIDGIKVVPGRNVVPLKHAKIEGAGSFLVAGLVATETPSVDKP